MLVPLKSLLHRTIQHGSLTVVLPNGEELSAGDGSGPPLTVGLSDYGAPRELFLNPELALGELYTDGRLTVSGGSIRDLLLLIAENLPQLEPPQIGHLRHVARTVFEGWTSRNSQRRAKENVHHHYDIDDRIYAMFLDSDRQYSCGYFESGNQSLEEAQLAKKRHIAAKLQIKPQNSVLDIGCGWGGLALYISKLCDANVTGLTLSPEQLRVAERRAATQNLGSRVRFLLQDYRTMEGTFDRVVSVGMFEHVGLRDYDKYFSVLDRVLKPDGVALLHSIGRSDGRSSTNPWFEKYIFPGSYVPSLAEILPAIEKTGLIVTDVEVLRLHYADTLAAWRSRFLRRRDEAAAIMDERFCRMWEFYLAAGEVGFRYAGLVVFQIQLAKKIDVLPRVRSYMAEEEDRLRTMEQAIESRVAAE